MAIPVWKPVVDYEGLYEVSSSGEIRSLFRYKKVLKPNITKLGYCSVELFKNGNSKRLLVHRIVARAFIPNSDNLPQVNHIDENPMNNSADNLEWCTAKYNMNYGEGAKTRHLKIDYSTQERKVIARTNGAKSTCKAVVQIANGVVVNRYDSIHDAAKAVNGSFAHIGAICNGKGNRKTHKGFQWEFE